MAGTGCLVVGVLAIVLGLFLCIAGPLLAPSQLDNAQTRGIKDYVVVDSTKAQQYSDWAGGYDDQMEYQMVYYMWNLTNADYVRANKGSTPEYTSHGPYVYRRHRASLNVSFPDNGNQAQFVDYERFVFDRASSVGPDTDVFTNFNPVYLGVLNQAGGEGAMLTALSFVYSSQAIDFLTGPFIPLFSTYVFSNFFTPKMNVILSELEKSLNSSTLAYDTFLSAWVNSTEPISVGNWTGMLVSGNSTSPSNISYLSASRLLDPNEQYSIISTDEHAAWVWANALTNSTFAEVLTSVFGVTQQQLKILIDWRLGVFAPIYIFPYYVDLYSLSSISDLGWVQWYDGDPLQGNSTCVVWPELNHDFSWEFFANLNGDDNSFTSWQFSKMVMDRQNGLTNGFIFQAFLLDFSNTNGAGNYSQWGLDQDQAALFFEYSVTMGLGFAAEDLTDKFGPSGGLIRSKSVQDWIFNCHDFIQDMLQPGGPSCSVQLNNTINPPHLIWTGKDDINKINQYIKWRNASSIEGLWNGSVPVKGDTELGQFTPGIQQGQSLHIFDDDLIRPLVLLYNNSFSAKLNIPAYRYILDWNSATSVSDVYFQQIPGLANMTVAEQSSPIFVSLYDLWGVNATKKVIGLVTNYTSEDQYNTIVEVEPITGLTVGSYKRVQTNLYIDPLTQKSFYLFSRFGNNPPLGIFLPFARQGEFVTISDPLAKQLKDKLKLVPTAKKDVLYISLTIGPALIIAGIAMIVIGLRRRRQGDYIVVN